MTVHNVRQAPYNAVADNTADDHDAIQAAVNASCGDGNPVFIPGGTYRIGSTIYLCHGVRIVGGSKLSAVLQAGFPGFVLAHPDDDYSCCINAGIENLSVKNSSTDWASGAILFANMNPGSYIRDCTITGMTGIDAQWNMFTAEISRVNFEPVTHSGYPMMTAVNASQVGLSNLKIGGYDIGISLNGPGGTINSVGVETTNTGLIIGRDRPAIFTGSISGTTLTISKWHVGHRLNWWGQTNWWLGCPFNQPCADGTQITKQLTNTNARGDAGKEGTYEVSVSQNVAAQTMAAWFNGLQTAGATINSFQTERDNISVNIQQATFTSINSSVLTGTLGVGIAVDSASWSSANGGTITYQLNYPSPGYTQGKHDCSMDGFANTAYNKGYHIPCDWNGRTVTVTGTGGDPGAWVPGYATVAPIQQTCILGGSLAQNVTISNTSCATSTIDGISLNLSSPFISIHNLLLLNSSLGRVATASNNAAGVRIFNSIPSWADLGLTYTMLPGVSANQTAPVRGELYYIVDANTSTIGANVTGGSGTTKGYVTWNGSAWTLVSK
jgi:Pectate lyase superfamily protein